MQLGQASKLKKDLARQKKELQEQSLYNYRPEINRNSQNIVNNKKIKLQELHAINQDQQNKTNQNNLTNFDPTSIGYNIMA